MKPDKRCALTFDDGPCSRMTPRVLDRLERFGIPADFFLVGKRINRETEAVLRRALTLGCELQNHSWDYESMGDMSSEEVRLSVERTSLAIFEATGRIPFFFRPPNLSISSTMLETIRLPIIGGLPGYDWDACGTSADERARSVLDNVTDGAVILLHDVQPEPHPTPEALDIIIPELLNSGYRFVTLRALLF